jgi:hypothetical protein
LRVACEIDTEQRKSTHKYVKTVHHIAKQWLYYLRFFYLENIDERYHG